MNSPDTATPAPQLEGTNVPELFAAVRRAVNALETLGGAVTVYRDKSNRRAFYLSGEEPMGLPERLREKICTIKTGAAWHQCATKLTGTLSAAAQALGYHWRPVGYYMAPEGPGLAKKGHAPKGSRLVVLATPHPAGFSR
jgi:hypothetical protein